MKLFLQKNAKFLSAGASLPDSGLQTADRHWPPTAGGFTPRPPTQPPPLWISIYAPANGRSSKNAKRHFTPKSVVRVYAIKQKKEALINNYNL